MKKISFFMIALFLSLASSPLDASEVLVFRNESMPFCGTLEGKDAGMAIDILNEVTRHGGPKFKFQALPWARAQVYVQQKKGTAIIPFTRTPAREANHIWVARLFSYEFRLSTCRNPQTQVSLPVPLTVEKVKNLRIGIIRGSAHIPRLIELGFTDLNIANVADENILRLYNGRIAAMAESQWVDSYLWKRHGYDSNELVIGPSIGATQHIYLGAALNFPVETTVGIRSAIEQMRQNGKIEEILSKWR